MSNVALPFLILFWAYPDVRHSGQLTFEIQLCMYNAQIEGRHKQVHSKLLSAQFLQSTDFSKTVSRMKLQNNLNLFPPSGAQWKAAVTATKKDWRCILELFRCSSWIRHNIREICINFFLGSNHSQNNKGVFYIYIFRSQFISKQTLEEHTFKSEKFQN